MKIINNFPKLTKLDNIENELTNKAPIDHSSTTTTYGTGSIANYGHVKLSDSYTSSEGAASASVAASSKAVADAYAEINSNLIEKTVSVWTSIETNASGVVCKMKNNRVVLNGYLMYPTNVAPGATVTVGTVGETARPTRAITILVGVLGNDAEIHGFTIGTLNVDGTIVVKNSVSINARHFYFDAVWDV